MIYSRFERFWHWAQVTLIFLLLFTALPFTACTTNPFNDSR